MGARLTRLPPLSRKPEQSKAHSMPTDEEKTPIFDATPVEASTCVPFSEIVTLTNEAIVSADTTSLEPGTVEAEARIWLRSVITEIVLSLVEEIKELYDIKDGPGPIPTYANNTEKTLFIPCLKCPLPSLHVDWNLRIFVRAISKLWLRYRY